MDSHPEDEPALAARPGENQLIWTVWLTYGAFYFCRTNLSAALPGIESELGLDKTRMGVVLLGLKVAYGVGQFVNGQLSEQFSARKMLAIGMLASAALNVLFGFGTGVYFFLFVWAMNGYAQSMGWTPCVRVIGNWIPVLRRGRAIGIVGTGYQVTAGLTYLVSGFSVWLMGWRGALWLPPLILVASAAVMLAFLRESPAHHAGGTAAGAAARRDRQGGGSFLETMRLTLTNPALWLLAISLGMLNACRYGFIDWGVSHLAAIERAKTQRAEIAGALTGTSLTDFERGRLDELLALDLVDDTAQKQVVAAIDEGLLPAGSAAVDRGAVLDSAVQYAVLPLGAVFGSILAGWATDRFFGGRRAPVICGLLLVLAGLTLIYEPVARASFVATMGLLVCIGFCIFGPQVLLVGTAPADLARPGTEAAAAGFVNFFGYLGAAVAGDLLTAYLAEHYGWQVAVYAWAGWALAAAVAVAFLWNASGRAAAASEQSRPESLPRAVPSESAVT
ncbi:MAG: MFS transporter [Planctomycetes bacterium]|nr:MFS transporter [Planctomycetota bacterium]